MLRASVAYWMYFACCSAVESASSLLAWCSFYQDCSNTSILQMHIAAQQIQQCSGEHLVYDALSALCEYAGAEFKVVEAELGEAITKKY